MQTPNEPSYQAPIPEPMGSFHGTGGNFTPGQPNGTMILILGILGVTLCGLCAPVAWVMGNNALSEIDAGRGDPAQRGNASIGRIIGMVGSGFLILAVVVFLIAFVFGLANGANRTNSRFQPPITNVQPR